MAAVAPVLPTSSGSPVRRRRPARTLRHAGTLAWRAILKIRRDPQQLIDVTLSPILFVTMFVLLFGGAISGGATDGGDRQDYLRFVLPGIMAQAIVLASMGTGVNLATDISRGIFDRFRSLPIARSSPLTGLILGDVVRQLVALAVVILYGVILGFRFRTGVLAVLAGCGLIMLFSFALGWIWAYLGLLVRSPQGVQGTVFLVAFPLTFASNIFVPAGTLPGWLRGWVEVNPVSQLADTARGLMIGGPVAGPLWPTLAWIAGIVLVFGPLAVWRYRRST
ncbi:ABC transporter permease [Plantactinospora solaniradicis]|uniref:Transport permease protein n=1 Tax=Plantactinospora solaniradicis TaxID=1723736 RepID=A0ABW1KH00_9ACTN